MNKKKEISSKKTALNFMQQEYIDEEFEKMFQERNKVNPVKDENNKLLLKDIFKNYLKLYILKLEEEKLKVQGDISKDKKTDEKEKIEDQTKEQEEKDIKEEDKDKSKEEQEEDKDKTKKEIEEKKDPNKSIGQNQIGYLDRVTMFQIMKRDIANDQIQHKSYCADEQLYYKTLLFEKTLQNDEEEYLKGLNEEDKIALTELKENIKDEELKNEFKIQEKFDSKLEKLEKLNNEWQALNDELEALYKRQEDEQFDINNKNSEYKDMKENITSRMLLVSKQVAELNPKEMQRQKDVKSKQMILKKSIVGPFQEKSEYKEAKGSVKSEIDKKDQKQEEQSQKIEKESLFNTEKTLKRTIELNKKHIDTLEEKLEDTSPTDIKLRSELLQEIQEVKVQNNSYEELEKSMNSSMKKEKDIDLEVANTEKEIEKETEKIEESFKEVNTYVEKEEQKEADFVLEDPTEQLDKDTLKEEAIEDVENYKEEPSVIPGLEEQVYSPEEANQEYVKYLEEEGIRSQERAMEELEDIENKGQEL